MIFFSSNGKKDYTEAKYDHDIFLVFGKESTGLSNSILNTYKEHTYKIPLHNELIRSLNVSNAVAISVYEGLRQIKNC